MHIIFIHYGLSTYTAAHLCASIDYMYNTCMIRLVSVNAMLRQVVSRLTVSRARPFTLRPITLIAGEIMQGYGIVTSNLERKLGYNMSVRTVLLGGRTCQNGAKGLQRPQNAVVISPGTFRLETFLIPKKHFSRTFLSTSGSRTLEPALIHINHHIKNVILISRTPKTTPSAFQVRPPRKSRLIRNLSPPRFAATR